MRNRKTLVPALFALTLFGGGCAATEQQKDEVIEAVSEVVESAVMLVTTVEIDESWKTYANKALGFEFRWPSRGTYAPMWQVSFMDGKDGRIKDGCVVEGDGGSERVAVGNAEFCHSWKDADSGLSDWYAVKHGEVYAVIAFTKDVTGYAEFSRDEYRANLDQIISTYKTSAK